MKYPWLVYSKYLDGTFSLSLCFGMECGKNGVKLDKLFQSPLTFWTTAHGKFDSHSSEKSEIHKFSVNILPLLSEELSKRHNGRREIQWLGTYACSQGHCLEFG